MTSWVELRVHGVSGTPPESLLGTPHVRQVAGDDYSRFFRPEPAPGGHVIEGYHWGKFTSGSWRQALTLLLVPFGMVNSAQFMLPEPRTTFSKCLHALAGACLRAIALVLTLLFTFAMSLILIDLIGWRWADKAGFLKCLPDDTVLQVCVSLSAVGVLLLGLMGWSGGTRRPPDPPGEVGAETTHSSLAGGFYTVNPNSPTLRMLHLAGALALVALLADLARTGTDPGDDGGALRICAVVGLGAVAAVVAILGDPEEGVSVSWGVAEVVQHRWYRVVGFLAPAFLAGAAVLIVLELGHLDGLDRQEHPGSLVAERIVDFDRVADGLMYGGIAAMALLYLALVAHLWRGDDFEWTRREAGARLAELSPVALLVLPAWQAGLLWARALAFLLVIVLLALGIWCLYRIVAPATPAGRDAFYFRPYAAGLAPFLVAVVSVFVGIGFSAATTTAVSNTFRLKVDRKVDVGTTPMLDRVAYAWGLTVGLIVLLVLAAIAYYALTARGYRAKVTAMYSVPAEDTTALPYGWLGRVARAAYVAQLKTLVPIIIIIFAAAGLLISGVQGYESLPCKSGISGLSGCREAPGLLDRLSEPRSDTFSIFLINVGAWVFVAGAGAVVTVSRGAIKSAGLRRGINVVWDVFSFWPHAVHPFVPRPYSRWTVVELRNRIRYHLGGSAGVPGDCKQPSKPEVVVCAHSQGSLITFAAMMKLTQNERDRIAFLSCGSQLRVIYPRAFPAYANLDALTWLFKTLKGRWVNLYRITDPLAGPVLSWKHDATASRHFPLPGGDALAPDDQPQGEGRSRLCGRDWRLADPVPYDANCEDGPVDAVHGHHDYWLDPSWPRALEVLRS
jgi:hypothetical protein